MPTGNYKLLVHFRSKGKLISTYEEYIKVENWLLKIYCNEKKNVCECKSAIKNHKTVKSILI